MRTREVPWCLHAYLVLPRLDRRGVRPQSKIHQGGRFPGLEHRVSGRQRSIIQVNHGQKHKETNNGQEALDTNRSIYLTNIKYDSGLLSLQS